MPALARLTVEGNPTRTVKRSALTGGAAALRAYLRRWVRRHSPGKWRFGNKGGPCPICSRATADEVALFESEEAGAPVQLPPGLAPLQLVDSASGSPRRGYSAAASSASTSPAAVAAAPPPPVAAEPPRSPPAVEAPPPPAAYTAAAAAPPPSAYAPPRAAAPAAPGGGGIAAAASAAVSAALSDAATSAWVFALREALSSSGGRLELKPAAFAPSGVLAREGAPLARILGCGPAGSDMSKAIRAIVLDGNALAPDGSALPPGLLAALPLLAEVSMAGCGLMQVGGWVRRVCCRIQLTR